MTDAAQIADRYIAVWNEKVRFSWALGPDTDADMIKGTDFIVVEDGRLQSVTGFLDKVPGGA
jgi:hypothetical protein